MRNSENGRNGENGYFTSGAHNDNDHKDSYAFWSTSLWATVHI